MAGATPQIEWYIARDGQQYGPLTDLEMQKFVELGHLRPTDLVWRQGFPDWRPALAVFPASIPPRSEPQSARPAHEPARPAQEPQRRQAPRNAASQQSYRSSPEPGRTDATQVAVSSPYDDHDDDGDDDELYEERPRRSRLRLVVVLVIVALLGGTIWLGMDLLPSPAKLISLMQVPSEPASDTAADANGARQTPASESTGSAVSGLDADLQRMPLWQLIKREFPDWYQERLQEAARLKSSGDDNASIARRRIEALVSLRRQHAEQALAASPAALRTIAESFLNNLKHLSALSVQACYGFISQGETSPQVLELMNSPEHAAQLQQQVIAVFEAVAEGRRSPQTHLPPRQTDYTALSQALNGRGWTDREVQLFSNPRALAKAPAEEVCKLVQDWFAAQLSIQDQDVQLRLLIESLKPVVAG